MQNINVVLGTDDNYVAPCIACITSIFENNKDLLCSIYILTEGLSDYNIKKFDEVSRRYNRKINIVKIDTRKFNKLITRGRFSKAMYNRFLIPEILKDQDFALYLDCDIIVNGSLSFFEKLNMKLHACAVVKDQMCKDTRLLNKRLGINTPYFNSGVIYMNLAYWRKFDLSSKCIDFICNNPRQDLILFPDQDALNVVLSGKVLYMPLTYNFQERFYLRSNNKFVDNEMLEEINKYRENPIIIHYTNTIKPWFKECSHPLKNLFVKYYSINLGEIKLSKYYTFSRRMKIIKRYYIRLISFIKEE